MTGWELRPVPFRYQLGDLTLFSITVPLQVRSVPVVSGEPDGPPAPPGPTAPGSRGYYLRSMPVAGRLPPLHLGQGFIRYALAQYHHGWIDLQAPFEQYQARFSAKTRSTLNRKLRRFASHCGGTLDCRCYRSPAEMREFFDHARAVSALTYQERLLDAGLPDSAEFRGGMEELAARDEVRAFVLFDRARPVSYLYLPARDGVLDYAYLGYDPAYARLSVGTVLHWLAIQSLFGEGRFRCLDFTEGESEHKRLFASHQRPCANVVFLEAGAGSALLAGSHWLMNRCSALLGAALDRLGVKAAVRRLLRRQV